MGSWSGRHAQDVLSYLLRTIAHVFVLAVCVHPAGRCIDAHLLGPMSTWRPRVEHNLPQLRVGADDWAHLVPFDLAC